MPIGTASIILTTIVGLLVWFFKGFLSDFKQIKEFYLKHREVDLSKVISEIDSVKREISKVELESKRYWSEHKINMENNQSILLERINHTNENNKANAVMLKEFFDGLEKRFERIESRFSK